jgi:hypothetical protein
VSSKRKRRADLDELDDRLRCRLLTGHDFDLYDGPARPAGALERLWRAHGSVLLAEHVAVRPGTRPWAWWTFDAPPDARKRLGGTGTPLGTERWFGAPRYYGEDYDTRDRPRYEPERDYLRRHGLLTPGELAQDGAP